MIRTETVAVEAYDTDLASFAAALDAAVATTCGRLEAEGAEVTSVAPVAMRVARNYASAHDAAHDSWDVENGVLVVVSYRTAG